MTGGKGLDDFRNKLLKDKRISLLHDYLNASTCFPNVAIEGGVCYFLWEAEPLNGKGINHECTIITHYADGTKQQSKRFLSEGNGDIFIRDNIALGILKKVKSTAKVFFDSLVSTRMPFGIGNIPIEKTNEKPLAKDDLIIYIRNNGTREYRYIHSFNASKNKDLIDKYKIFISKADGAAGQIGNPIPARIIGKGEIGEPHTICTETFLVVGPFNNKEEAQVCLNYMKTKFFRFLVGIRKNKNMTKDTYKFAPLIDFTKSISNQALYKQYKLSDNEISYIETMIQEMN